MLEARSMASNLFNRLILSKKLLTLLRVQRFSRCEGKQEYNFLSFRTSIYILGLICTSEEGRREVQKHNWISSVSQGVSVCLPRDPSVLFKVADYTYTGDLSQRNEIWDKVNLMNETLPLTKDE